MTLYGKMKVHGIMRGYDGARTSTGPRTPAGLREPIDEACLALPAFQRAHPDATALAE